MDCAHYDTSGPNGWSALISTKDALIICAAGSKIGIGHLMRARLLAAALGRFLGSPVETWVICRDPIKLMRNEKVIPCLPHEIMKLVREEKSNRGRRLLVVDIPWWLPGFYTQLDTKPATSDGPFSVSIDGPITSDPTFDITLLPTFHLRDKPGVGPRKFFFGWDCYLLPNRSIPAEEKEDQLVVVTGGSDVARLGEQWPVFLENSLPRETRIIWVQGPLAPPPRIPKQTSSRFEVIVDPTNLRDIFSKSKWGLVVHGVSSFEMMASGMAIVTYSPHGEKDREELEALEELEVCEVARSPSAAVKRLAALMANDERTTEISFRASSMLAKRGEETLVQILRERSA